MQTFDHSEFRRAKSADALSASVVVSPTPGASKHQEPYLAALDVQDQRTSAVSAIKRERLWAVSLDENEVGIVGVRGQDRSASLRGTRNDYERHVLSLIAHGCVR